MRVDMTTRRALAVSLLALMWQALALSPALAINCTTTNIVSFQASSVVVPNYIPFAGTPQQANAVVTIATNAKCTNVAVAFSGTSATFAPVAANLSYALAATAPTTTTPLQVLVNNAAVTLTFSITVAAAQFVGSGNYSSLATGIPLQVYLLAGTGNGQFPTILRAVPLDVNVFVPKICRLLPPSATSVDFSSAITAGMPDPGVVKNISLTGAACTAPTRIKLNGSALQPTPSIGPQPGMDNFINWHAHAAFASAVSDLNTTGTIPAQAVSPLQNTATSGFTSGNISLDINLRAGNQIQTGSYSGILTMTIDPLL